MDINVILIIIGIIALIALVAHGLWSNRKEKMQIFENEKTFSERSNINSPLEPMPQSNLREVLEPNPIPYDNIDSQKQAYTFSPHSSVYQSEVEDNFSGVNSSFQQTNMEQESPQPVNEVYSSPYQEMEYAPQPVVAEPADTDMSLEQIKISLPNSQSQREYYEDRVKDTLDYTMQTQLRSRDLAPTSHVNSHLANSEVENYYPEPNFSPKVKKVEAYYPEPASEPQVSQTKAQAGYTESIVESAMPTVENYYPEPVKVSETEIQEYYPDLQSRKARTAEHRTSANMVKPLHTEVKPAAKPVEVQEKEPNLAILYVMAAPNTEFTGLLLLKVFNDLGFLYGDRQLYHRHLDYSQTSPSLFSIVDLRSGTFNPNQMEYFSSRGVALVMDIDASSNSLADFRLMLRTAREMATQLGGYLVDDKQRPFDEISEAQYIQRCE